MTFILFLIKEVIILIHHNLELKIQSLSYVVPVKVAKLTSGKAFINIFRFKDNIL